MALAVFRILPPPSPVFLFCKSQNKIPMAVKNYNWKFYEPLFHNCLKHAFSLHFHYNLITTSPSLTKTSALIQQTCNTTSPWGGWVSWFNLLHRAVRIEIFLMLRGSIPNILWSHNTRIEDKENSPLVTSPLRKWWISIFVLFPKKWLSLVSRNPCMADYVRMANNPSCAASRINMKIDSPLRFQMLFLSLVVHIYPGTTYEVIQNYQGFP